MRKFVLARTLLRFPRMPCTKLGLVVASACLAVGLGWFVPPALAADHGPDRLPQALHRWQSAPPGSARVRAACVDEVSENPALNAALAALSFDGTDGSHPLRDVRIAGLTTLDEKKVWQALGGHPATPDAAAAVVVMHRIAALGVFASIKPVIDLRDAANPALVITVTEQPTIKKVVVEGLGEVKPQALLEALLKAPSRHEVDERLKKLDQVAAQAADVARTGGASRLSEAIERRRAQAWRGHDDDDQGVGDNDEVDHPRDRAKPAERCPEPLPDRDWLARAEGDVVFPGLIWKGLPAALDRVVERLFDRGYDLASLHADLGPDGTLTVKIDEGRVTAVELRGVDPAIESDVRGLLAIDSNRPFVRGDLDQSARRVRAAFPFLQTDSSDLPTRARPKVIEPQPHRYETTEIAPQPSSRWYSLEDGHLVLSFKARRIESSLSAKELIHHTPVTGFAPGLEETVRLWDPANRLHARLEAGGNVNTHWAHELATPTNPAPDRWRFDWVVGGSLAVPTIRLAELGLQGYSRVDTADRWRMNRLDSYLYSLVFNRADTDYFRRDGLTAFATFHVAEQLTAGVEYRRDHYRSLRSTSDMWTLFNRDEAPQPTAAIDEGEMGSMLVRLEWSTHKTPAHRVGSHHRDPERSLIEIDGNGWWTEARTVDTLEIADPALGGDDAFKFTKVVSDSEVFLRTGNHQGLKVRFRAAGKLGGDRLPLEKQESLGGWTDVRGYDFKEERGGDFSLLGTAEYRARALSAFVDIGSLRRGGAFGTAKTGLGLALNFSDQVHLDVAWRADDQARWRPSARLLFHRTY